MTDACEHCPQEVARAVASRGPVPARVLLLSGAPRYHEEHAGVAFASPLFPWLEEQLAAAGIDPADVHYATLIGCRPWRQRPLRDSEIVACAPRLGVTIAAVAPRVIVLCGPDAVAALLPGVSLSSAHGTLARRGHRRYYPIRHPYAALHSERYVEEMMDDLRRLSALLDEDWPVELENGAHGQTPQAAPETLAQQAPPVSGTTVSKSAMSFMEPAMDRIDSGGSSSDTALSTVLPVSTAPASTETASIEQGAAPRQQGDRPDAIIDDAGDPAPAEGDSATRPEQRDEADETDSPTQLSLF